MKILNLTQGSPEWLERRKNCKNASEAPVIMGASPHKTRDQLLHEKKTGAEQEQSPFTESLFRKGHAAEAAARPIVESGLGEELYPVVAIRDGLGASFDGITLMEDVVWECKLWNEAKATDARAGKAPEQDYWQVVQQFYVSGAQKVIYTVTDGTEDKLESLHIERSEQIEQDIKRLLAAWDQFDKDLAAYEPQEDMIEAVGRSPDDLPALRVEITGMVKASNLEQFKTHADSVIKSVNRDLITDQDFADAEKTVKWLADVEKRIDAAKEHALSQTASIDDLFKALDGIKEDYRATRLELNRLVTAEKTNRREQIRKSAQAKYDEQISEYNKQLGGHVVMPAGACDIAGAMKGKRTMATLEGAANTEVANALASAAVVFGDIKENIDALAPYIESHGFLLNDMQELVLRPKKDMLILVEARIAQHEAALKAQSEKVAEQKTVRQSCAQTPAQQEAPIDERTEKPSASAIIAAVSGAFGVDESTAREWILETEF